MSTPVLGLLTACNGPRSKGDRTRGTLHTLWSHEPCRTRDCTRGLQSVTGGSLVIVGRMHCELEGRSLTRMAAYVLLRAAADLAERSRGLVLARLDRQAVIRSRGSGTIIDDNVMRMEYMVSLVSLSPLRQGLANSSAYWRCQWSVKITTELYGLDF